MIVTALRLFRKDPAHLPAIWAFCCSGEHSVYVRKIDQKVSVQPHTLLKVPFDLSHWQRIANEKYPSGLPEPHSDDPTQWLFKGDPVGSESPIQVAVARLLGYQWPEQPDSDDLISFADKDGSCRSGRSPTSARRPSGCANCSRRRGERVVPNGRSSAAERIWLRQSNAR